MEIIEKAEKFVRRDYGKDPDHGFEHAERVLANAKKVAAAERRFKEIDWEILHLAILFHDTGRVASKIEVGENTHEKRTANIARTFLKKQHYQRRELVCRLIESHDKKGKYPLPESIVLEEADYLDVLGTLGIARIFSYGGQIKRDLEGSLKYLEEKTWKHRLQTKYGKREAAKRRGFVRRFIKQLKKDLDKKNVGT